VNWPAVPWSRVPSLASGALRKADLEAQTRFAIEPRQLMEIAGWQIATFVNDFLGGLRGKQVIVVAGAGNNGGDALVAARFILQRGARVRVSLVAARDPGSLPAQHATTVRALGIACDDAPAGIDQSADVIIDGLLGTGIRMPLRQPAPEVIAAMNATGVQAIAIDIPSGMDADTSAGADDAVRATATLTLAAPKRALKSTKAAGRVFLADIGMPAALFGPDGEALAAVFATADLVELVPA
jgi:hydroxyethylthiazole kinase-like uncharacterized protein yjeF